MATSKTSSTDPTAPDPTVTSPPPVEPAPIEPTPADSPLADPTSAPPPKAAMGWRDRRKEQQEAQAKADQAADDVAYKKAVGVMDDETRDKILALGGDVSRSSPAVEQPLPDAEPGFTTTTGAHRVPIDPTTAAVPADPNDPEILKRPKGFPTIGSGREGGKPEQHFKPRDTSPPTSTPGTA